MRKPRIGTAVCLSFVLVGGSQQLLARYRTGPVFGANTAYGIIHAKVVATGMVGHMLFMPITRISGLGLSVATTP